MQAWRAARVRHQGVVDAVVTANEVFGLFNVVFGAVKLVEGIVFLYYGTVLAVKFQWGEPDAKDLDPEAFWDGGYDGTKSQLFSIYYLFRLIFICVIGEQVKVEVSALASSND